MELFEPGPLIASFVIGTIGLGQFVFGKRQSRGLYMLAGLALMIFPYFVPRVPVMVAVAIGILGVTWLVNRWGY